MELLLLYLIRSVCRLPLILSLKATFCFISFKEIGRLQCKFCCSSKLVCFQFCSDIKWFMKLLDLVEFKLKEVISREPTLLVMVVGVPNVGKSALINSIHQIASYRFPCEFFSFECCFLSLDVSTFTSTFRFQVFLSTSPKKKK